MNELKYKSLCINFNSTYMENLKKQEIQDEDKISPYSILAYIVVIILAFLNN